MNTHNQLYKIPSVLMRGGTSKGLIIKDIDLPSDPIKRDLLISTIYGSSTNGQIDGVGGGTSLTSKLAIVGKTDKYDCDILYTFGQVSVNSRKIDYNVTCGNMASAVGLFAVEEGLVDLEEGITTVKIYNTNTKRVMEVEVPVKDGMASYDGDFRISGVSGTSSLIMVNFLDFGGAYTGKLLPTGNVIDFVTGKNSKEVEVTIMDVGNVLVFVRAKDFSIKGTELSEEINNNQLLNEQLEYIRIECGKMLGIFGQDEVISPETHALPKIVLVSEPIDYTNESGSLVSKSSININGRYITMGKLHRAFAVSGSIGLGAACKIPGTIPNLLATSDSSTEVIIGHPTGTLLVSVDLRKTDNSYTLVKGGTGRTARRIMEGNALIPTKVLERSNN